MSDMMTQEEGMNMSNEQAVQILIPMRNMMCDQNGCPISDAVFALDKAIEALSTDRPQGEWIDKGWKGDWQFETDGRGNCWKVFECSVCNGWDTRKTRFCPRCGAHMKGADDE